MTSTSQLIPRLRWCTFAAALVVLAVLSPRCRSHASPSCPDSTTVAEITVGGNERTESHVILREMHTRVGRAYDAGRVERDRDRIDNLDLFSEVVIDTLRADGRMTLRVRVRERLVWLPTEWIPYPILNWNEETEWTYGFGLTNPNESGRNRSFTLVLQGGGHRLGYFSYSDPWIVGNHGSAALSASFSEYEDFEGQTNRWTSVGMALGSYVRSRGRVKVSFQGSEIETDEWRTASGTRLDQIRSIGLGAAYDTRDVYSDPRSGLYSGGSLELVRPMFVGTVRYTSYRFDLRGFVTPLPSHVLAAGVSVIVRDRPVPDYRRLRMGGVSGVRGIHPLSFKGRNRIFSSLEYRVAVKEKKSYDFWFVRNVDLGLMVVVFSDVGAVWDGDRHPDRDEFFGSIGAGIRILSQQVVRLEVGHSRRDGTQWIAATGMPF